MPSYSHVGRWVSNTTADLKDLLTGRHDPEIPPRRLQHVGRGDFREQGNWLAAMLVQHGLSPRDRVLDIGSGIGRVALALTRILSDEGRYDGFDADARAVRWCQRSFTPRHPSFRFVHADVSAGAYHRSASSPAQFRFPFDDAIFDFAFATSVFTHLEISAAKHYCAEARRVLRPGGRLVATAFLHDGSPSALSFPVDRGDSYLMDAANPTSGVAFAYDALPSLLPPTSWSDVQLHEGNWRSTGSFSVRGQDVLVATA